MLILLMKLNVLQKLISSLLYQIAMLTRDRYLSYTLGYKFDHGD